MPTADPIRSATIPTAAQSAAQRLPASPHAGGAEVGRGDWGNAIVAVAIMSAMPLGLAGYLLTRPWGWLAVVTCVPLWLGGRWLFGRLAPDQAVPTVVAEPDGTVRVIRRRRMISAYRRMLDSGAGRWFGRGVLLGFLLLIIGAAVGVAGLAVLGTDLGVALLSAEVLVAMLAFCAAIYHGMLTPLRLRARGLLVLDADQVMPLLGLYAARHGDEAAAAGVPADRLLATAAEVTEAERAAVAGQPKLADVLKRRSGT